jgi:hypothetical protein
VKNKARTTWSQDEIILVFELREAKTEWAEIAARVGRTIKGVKAQYYFFSRSPEKQADLNEAKKAYRKAWRSRGGKTCMEVRVERPRDIPDETIEMRKIRSAAPQTLTGAIFGDPPIGFSALDMRGQQ